MTMFLESFDFFSKEIELKEANIAAETRSLIGKVSEVKDGFMKKLGFVNNDFSKNATNFNQRIKDVKSHSDQMKLEHDIEFEIRALQGIDKVLKQMEEDEKVSQNPNFKKLASTVTSYINNYEKILDRVEKLNIK
jgi:cellulose biosynthesis protein BcsQ